LTYRPDSDHDKSDTAQQPDPSALTDQNIGNDGDAEGSQHRIDGIAGRNPEPGDEAATPAARESAPKNQEGDRAWRRGNWEPDAQSERQCPGHLRLACPARHEPPL